MTDKKYLMADIALLYYKKGLTQQEIADSLHLTRQTVSKLLTLAVAEGVVEIKIRKPEQEQKEMVQAFQSKYQVKAVIGNASQSGDDLREMAAIEAAIAHLAPILQEGNLKIAVSWGRSVQAFIKQFPTLYTKENCVFPLFGSMEHEQPYFHPNELAREFANKLDARVKYAWFPYQPENEQDLQLFQRTVYYKNMQTQWNSFDLAIIGVGNNTAFQLLDPNITKATNKKDVIGDVATHFFSVDGTLIETNDCTLRISADSLKNTGKKIAIAYGDNKVNAIIGALKAGFIDTLITDEYTARAILSK